MHTKALIAAALLGVAGLAVGCSIAPTPESAPEPPVEETVPASATPDAEAPSEALTVTSTAFADGEAIPLKYATVTAGGENLSIPLSWSGAPSGTVSFAIEVVDLHPAANNWVHWLVIGIPGDVGGLPEGWSGASHGGARELANGFGRPGWGGPQPPVGSGAHIYRVTLYALGSGPPSLAENATLAQFRAALEPQTLATATLTGSYER